MKEVTKKLKKLKNTLIGLTLTAVLLSIMTILLWQVPIARVLAEGESPLPPPILTLRQIGCKNASFILENTNLNFTLNGETYLFQIQKATVTLITTELAVNESSLWFYFDIEGLFLDSPQFTMTLNKLQLEMTFFIHGNISFYKIVTTAYVPVYKIIETALAHLFE